MPNVFDVSQTEGVDLPELREIAMAFAKGDRGSPSV
jgi:hypothetical protein